MRDNLIRSAYRAARAKGIERSPQFTKYVLNKLQVMNLREAKTFYIWLPVMGSRSSVTKVKAFTKKAVYVPRNYKIGEWYELPYYLKNI